jgi:hypothetical protein
VTGRNSHRSVEVVEFTMAADGRDGTGNIGGGAGRVKALVWTVPHLRATYACSTPAGVQAVIRPSMAEAATV